MKRILLIALCILPMHIFAKDVHISSWIELQDISLQPGDCIIKHEIFAEYFYMPKSLEPQEKVDLDRNCTEEDTEPQESKEPTEREDEPVVLVDEHEAKEGVRYYVDSDNWRLVRKIPFARRIVLVAESERDKKFMRIITVIAPKVRCGGVGFLGEGYMYEATEEYQFSNPVKVATTVLGIVAGILAAIKLA